MDNTTADYLESIRDSITQEIISANSAKIAFEFHELRTHLQNVLGDFASQSDLEAIVEKAINTASEVAAGVAGKSVQALERAQTVFQEEQRQKVQTFIDDMRGRMDTFATTASVESLRARVEDVYGHFESITGGHGEAIYEIKDRLKALEDSTTRSIGAIRADTKSIKDNAQKTSEAVVRLIDEYEKHQRETVRELANLKDAQDMDVKNLRRVESEMHTLDALFRDIDTRVRDGMIRIEHALFGDEKTKTQGIFTIVKKLQADLRLPSLLFGTKWGLRFGVPAIYLFTVYWMQHPDLFAAFNPFGR